MTMSAKNVAFGDLSVKHSSRVEHHFADVSSLRALLAMIELQNNMITLPTRTGVSEKVVQDNLSVALANCLTLGCSPRLNISAILPARLVIFPHALSAPNIPLSFSSISPAKIVVFLFRRAFIASNHNPFYFIRTCLGNFELEVCSAEPRGLEPPTFAFAGQRSIPTELRLSRTHLSFGPGRMTGACIVIPT